MARHVQMLVDVVIPDEVEPFVHLAEIIEILNAELHRHGMQESVWAVRLPEDRA